MKGNLPTITVLLFLMCLILLFDEYDKYHKYDKSSNLPCQTDKIIMQEVCESSDKTWGCHFSQIQYMACLRDKGYLKNEKRYIKNN